MSLSDLNLAVLKILRCELLKVLFFEELTTVVSTERSRNYHICFFTADVYTTSE